MKLSTVAFFPFVPYAVAAECIRERIITHVYQRIRVFIDLSAPVYLYSAALKFWRVAQGATSSVAPHTETQQQG